MKKILLAQDTIDKNDFDRLIEWLKIYPRLTKGEKTIEFETQWAKAVGSKYAVFVNSGSSANLLMLYSLITANRLKNDKIVVPALSWITDISPVIQFGLLPVLVDCNNKNLSVDIKQLQFIFETQQPAALLLVSILGLVPDMDEIVALCKKYGVLLLIDNCEGLGSKHKGNNLETYGLMASCSTYYGHIISTIEGGMITTDDEELYNTLKMLRSHGWDRDLSHEKKQEIRTKHNISGFNSLYTFYTTGFNVRSTDLSAYIGIGQLDKLDAIVKKRNENYLLYKKQLNDNIWKPQEKEGDFVSNLGYPVISQHREKIVNKLIENNVEVRPLVSGSMGCQPFFTGLWGYKQIFTQSDIIDHEGFYVPNHPMLTEDDIKLICNIINETK